MSGPPESDLGGQKQDESEWVKREPRGGQKGVSSVSVVAAPVGSWVISGRSGLWAHIASLFPASGRGRKSLFEGHLQLRAISVHGSPWALATGCQPRTHPGSQGCRRAAPEGPPQNLPAAQPLQLLGVCLLDLETAALCRNSFFLLPSGRTSPSQTFTLDHTVFESLGPCLPHYCYLASPIPLTTLKCQAPQPRRKQQTNCN